MPLLNLLSDGDVWIRFYHYKQSLALSKQFTGTLRTYIERKDYLPVCMRIRDASVFPLARKAFISKMGSDRKRIVYTYPEPENTVLKLLTWLLLRRYNHIFVPELYSFRPGQTAKDAVKCLFRSGRLRQMYAYKADIHDYFNSIPVSLLLPMLEDILQDEKELFRFLAALLTEPCVSDHGKIIAEARGIMAGTPLSAFYANIYLSELDRHFHDAGIPYARFSDDIILFAETQEAITGHADYIHAFLLRHGLTINLDKEVLYQPGESIVFLGFCCHGKTVDIAPASVKKIKQKMRRKRDALARWCKRTGTERSRAAKAFIRIFNSKFYSAASDNDLCWSHWYFPVITTADSLRAIDRYAQDCIRYLLSGTHTKARFNIRYSVLKSMGYRSLVNAYYSSRSLSNTAQ